MVLFAERGLALAILAAHSAMVGIIR